jgi:type I restriction enzyme S subunit
MQVKRQIGQLLERVVCPVEVQKDAVYQEIGIRSHCKGIFHKPQIRGKQIGNKRVFWVKPDCFIYNIIFAWEQAIAVTSKNEEGMIASHRFPMYRSTNGQYDPKYAFLYFSSPRGKYDLGLASPGGAGRNKTLGLEEFKRIKVPVPSIEYQKIAVDVICIWDEGIKKIEKLIAAKQKQKKALMQQLLTGKRRFKEFNKQNWKECHLKDLLTTIESGSRPRGGAKQGAVGIPSLGGENIRMEGGLELSNLRKVSESYYKSMNSGKLRTDDVLINKDGANTGKVAIYNCTQYGKACINEHLFILRGNDSLDQVFLYYYLLSDIGQKKVKETITGSAQPGITTKFVNPIKLLIPQKEEQKTIVSILIVADQEINILQKQLEALKQQKKGLMQKLLTGKIRVRV